MPPRTLVPLALLLAAACDLPTQLPEWDTGWDVAVLTDTISTAELLPDDVRIAPEGFVVDGYAAESTVRLGDVCELCTCFDGPIPPITIAEHDWPVRLPPGLLSAEITSGRAELVLHNDAGFDVMDDGLGGRGHLRVRLIDTRDESLLEELWITESFPPGDSLRLTFELPRVELAPWIVARVSGRTPGSGLCDVDLGPESGFRARVVLEDVVARSVEAIVSDADLAIPSRDFGLPGALADRLRPGDAEVVLEVDVDSRLPTAVELTLSAAGAEAALFGAGAALYTPLLLPRGDAADAGGRTVRRFLVDLERLEGAERLWFAGRSRVQGSRVVRLDGDERLSYRVRVLARVPSR